MNNNNGSPSFDSFLPPEMAAKAENSGVAKANLGFFRMMALAILAGAFIGLGAAFATVATTGAAGLLPFGISKLIGGLVFCLGLILVVVAGAELFTVTTNGMGHFTTSTPRSRRRFTVTLPFSIA